MQHGCVLRPPSHGAALLQRRHHGGGRAAGGARSSATATFIGVVAPDRDGGAGRRGLIDADWAPAAA